MKFPAVGLAAFGALASQSLSSEAFVLRSMKADVAIVDAAGCRLRVVPSSSLLAAVQGDVGAESQKYGEPSSHRRRQLLALSVQKAVAAVGASAWVVAASSVRSAAAAGDTFEDLAMPTEEDQSQQQSPEDAMAARIRLKAELKKKAAEPKTFTDSLLGEQRKQKEMSKRTKEEQRAALCEELGRGC